MVLQVWSHVLIIRKRWLHSLGTRVEIEIPIRKFKLTDFAMTRQLGSAINRGNYSPIYLFAERRADG